MMIAFREIDQGYQGMCTFTNVMSIPPPLLFPGYQLINNNLNTFYNNAASKSTSIAVLETKNLVTTNLDNFLTAH